MKITKEVVVPNYGLEGTQGPDGKPAIYTTVTNQNIVLNAPYQGLPSDYSKANGSIQVFEGDKEVTQQATYTLKQTLNTAATLDFNKFKVTHVSDDNGMFVVTVKYKEFVSDIMITTNVVRNGQSGPKGDNGQDGPPTGIIESPTIPTEVYQGMLWKNTGNLSGFITDVTYIYRGSKWEKYIFTADNIVANTLSALSAYLGNVQGGSITGAEFINKGELYNPAINKMCSFETVIKGPITTNYSEKGGVGKGAFYLSPYQIGGSYSRTGNLQRTDESWSLGGSGVWLETGNETSGNWAYTSLQRGKLELFEQRFNGGTGDFNLTISDIAKYTPTQLEAAPGYSIYSTSEENLPTAKRSGRTVTLSGAFKNNNNVSTGDNEILLGYLPKWAAPKDIERSVCQGSGMNRFLLTVRPNGNIYWSRYGSSSSYGTTGTGAWLNINIRYDGVDL